MNLPLKDIHPNNQVGHLQRVLVLQGGGSLGAYEAGVYVSTHKRTN